MREAHEKAKTFPRDAMLDSSPMRSNPAQRHDSLSPVAQARRVGAIGNEAAVTRGGGGSARSRARSFGGRTTPACIDPARNTARRVLNEIIPGLASSLNAEPIPPQRSCPARRGWISRPAADKPPAHWYACSSRALQTADSREEVSPQVPSEWTELSCCA
jgi:hypothetical protein